MERLKLSPVLLLWVAAALLLLPVRWLGAWLAAVTVHELGHFAMLRLLGLPVHSLRMDGVGAKMQTLFTSRGQELLCALAGPLAGFLMLGLADLFPRTAVCSVFLSLYNLLPVYPMDGGRCIRCLAGERAAAIVGYAALGCIFILGFYGSFCLKLGWLPFTVGCFTVIRALKIKIPCKAPLQALQ